MLNDVQLHSLLNLYDNINTSPDRPFRFPPTDACVRLKECAAALKVIEVTEDEAGDAEELREIVTRHHMMALIQVIVTDMDSWAIEIVVLILQSISVIVKLMGPEAIVTISQCHNKMILQYKNAILYLQGDHGGFVTKSRFRAGIVVTLALN